MVRIWEHGIELATQNTTYLIGLLPSGHLEHLYYGGKIAVTEGTFCALTEKKAFLQGNAVAYSKEFPNLGLEDMCLELGSYGKGDLREPMIELTYADGNTTCDFLYEECHMAQGDEWKSRTDGYELPYATGNAVSNAAEGNETPAAHDEETLLITLKDKVYQTKLTLSYRVFTECDAITRSTVLTNEGESPLTVRRLLSLQLDFAESWLVMSTFNGAWSNEMNRNLHRVTSGMHVNESMAGVSSSRANPFVMIHREDTSAEQGFCIGCNLIYSGNHVESLSVNGYGKSRFLTGINPKNFNWTLAAGGSFAAPEAVLVCSTEGFDGMSARMHSFVKEHIVRGEWQHKDRPILMNSWEASYFKFTESKLLRLAKAAKELGMELFVLDDGWFGHRDNDQSSLGDWIENRKKLPGGLSQIAGKLKDLGMEFGIWVEPEMVSEDSDCYRRHPEWAVRAPHGEHSEGRKQMLLDLSNPEVQKYLIDSMSAVFDRENLTYVKWDMNRVFSDAYLPSLPAERQGEAFHRYTLGLYAVMQELTSRFPHILFEGCAAGGNRFDLGILCYMPQIWASDNTDAICRMKIQYQYSYGYPMSVISAHVSGCPNHQTLRVTPLSTRFAVAAFGILGYECNLMDLSKEEREEIRAQILLYKQYRHLLQSGDFYRLQEGNVTKWMTVSKDRTEAVCMMTQIQTMPNSTYESFRTKGLLEETTYSFTNLPEKKDIRQFGDLINTMAPIHVKPDSLLHNTIAKFVHMDGETEEYVVTGSVLNECGVRLKQSYSGTGYSGEVRLFQDYHSRMYFLKASADKGSL